MIKTQEFDAFLTSVRESPLSDFYRKHWRGEVSFNMLPHTSRADFAAVPLSLRRYKREKGMVKIVGSADAAFLSEWSFNDISAVPYTPPTRRPMVYLSDSYEAVEKAMWCYGNGMTPLVGEKDPDAAMFAAGRYKIDSLITDEVSLIAFAPFLATLSEPLSSIVVIGPTFFVPTLLSFARYARVVRLVLSLPETGAFAAADLSPSPKFTPYPGCMLERDSDIVLTKDVLYPTPIIRYRTGVAPDVLG